MPIRMLSAATDGASYSDSSLSADGHTGTEALAASHASPAATSRLIQRLFAQAQPIMESNNLAHEGSGLKDCAACGRQRALACTTFPRRV